MWKHRVALCLAVLATIAATCQQTTNAPPAMTPLLDQVLKPGSRQGAPFWTNIQPNANGEYEMLPSASVILRFRTPYPSNIECNVDTDLLEQTLDVPRQLQLESQGLGWCSPDIALVGSTANYQLVVAPAPPKRRGQRFVISLTNISINPQYKGTSQERSAPLLVTVIDPSSVPPPPPPLPAPCPDPAEVFRTGSFTSGVTASPFGFSHALDSTGRWIEFRKGTTLVYSHFLQGQQPFFQVVYNAVIPEAVLIWEPGVRGHHEITLLKLGQTAATSKRLNWKAADEFRGVISQSPDGKVWVVGEANGIQAGPLTVAADFYKAPPSCNEGNQLGRIDVTSSGTQQCNTISNPPITAQMEASNTASVDCNGTRRRAKLQ